MIIVVWSPVTFVKSMQLLSIAWIVILSGNSIASSPHGLCHCLLQESLCCMSMFNIVLVFLKRGIFHWFVTKTRSLYSSQISRACCCPSQRFRIKESNQIFDWLDLIEVGWGNELTGLCTKAFNVILRFSLLNVSWLRWSIDVLEIEDFL